MDFKYLALAIVGLGLIFLLWPMWRQNVLLFSLVISLMAATFLYLILQPTNLIEPLQISGEAVQNVGSIYNSDQMTIKNLTSTSTLTANNQTVTGSSTLANATVNGPLAVSGPVTFGGTVTANSNMNVTQNLSANKLSVGGITMIPGSASPIGVKVMIGDGTGWQYQFCKNTGDPVVTITDNGDVEITGNVVIKGNLTANGTTTAKVRQPIGCDRYLAPVISWMSSCDNRGPVGFFEYNADGSIAGHYGIGDLIK
jgi:cytoskeletal protein CcmA (bactofilin family)